MKDRKSEFLESKFFKFIQKYWLYIVVTIAVIVVAISGIQIYREEVLEIDPNTEVIVQDTISLPSSTIDTLNPIVSKSEDVYYLSKLMYDSLFEYTDNLNVQEDLVQSYTVNTEKAYIDITLKDGILWHDGSELQAQDISFTVNAIKAYGAEGLYYENASKINTVNVKDSSTLRIYFYNNYDCSLDNLTFPILPSSKYKSAASLIKDVDDFVPVGTGQYQYSSYDSSKELCLIPNDSYYGTKAKNNITFKILPDKTWAYNLMEIDSITCYIDKSTQKKSIAADKNLQMYEIVSNDVDFLVFNTSSGLFKSKEMRQAACYAIDKDKILEDAYINDAVVSDTIYYPNFLGVTDNNTYYNFDTKKATELLKEAGYEDKNLNGKITDSNNKGAEINILVNTDNANRIAAAKVIADNLRSVGFEVETTAVEWDEYVKLIEQKDFDILITGYEIEASYDLREFFDGTNPWGYLNSDMLAQARDLERLHTTEEYKTIYENLKEMMLDEVPYYSICYKKIGLLGIDTFEAQQLPTFDNIYKNCNTWSWKKIINKAES